MRSVLAFSLLLVSCASGPCKEPKAPADRPLTPAVAPSQKTAEVKIKVAKSDGSKQCGAKQGLTPEAMESQLKGIKVYSREKKNDGLMRIQMCGADTGQHNVYEIDASQLEAAKKLGFEEWAQQ